MATTVVQTVVVQSVINKWWLPCGCLAADCEAAYLARGAGSLANSLVNVNNPGVKDLYYVNAPYWTDYDGWAFDGVASHGILYTGDDIHVDANITVVVKFNNYSYPDTNLHYLFGAESGPSSFGANMFDDLGTDTTIFNENVPSVSVENKYTSGILAFLTTDMFKDGVSVSPTISGSFILDGYFSPAIGGIASTGDKYVMVGNIHAIAFYNKQLTQQQIQDIGSALP